MLPASTPCEPGSFNPYRESQKPGLPGVCIFAVFPLSSPAPGWLIAANQQMISRARNGTIEQHSQQRFVEDLANTWAYARAHREEIEQQISENEAA